MISESIQSTSLPFQPIENSNFLRGFWNLLRKENTVWWKRKRWFIVAIMAILLVNGMIQLMIMSSMSVMHTQTMNGKTASEIAIIQSPYVSFFPIALFIVSIITALSITQGAVIDERKSGTMSWILSKPASRKAFILTKFLTHSFAIFLLTIVLPTGIYILQRYQTTAPLQFDKLGIEILLISLDLLFYISFSLLAGVIIKSRKAVLGITLGYFFIRMFFNSNNTGINGLQFLPGMVVQPILGLEATNAPVSNDLWITALITLVAIVVCLGIALGVFEKEEI